MNVNRKPFVPETNCLCNKVIGVLTFADNGQTIHRQRYGGVSENREPRPEIRIVCRRQNQREAGMELFERGVLLRYHIHNHR